MFMNVHEYSSIKLFLMHRPKPDGEHIWLQITVNLWIRLLLPKLVQTPPKYSPKYLSDFNFAISLVHSVFYLTGLLALLGCSS